MPISIDDLRKRYIVEFFKMEGQNKLWHIRLLYGGYTVIGYLYVTLDKKTAYSIYGDYPQGKMPPDVKKYSRKKIPFG